MYNRKLYNQIINSISKVVKKQITEAFDFDSVKKQNKSINAVDAALQYIIQKIDKREKLSKDEYNLLKNCVGIYKVSDHDELQGLIKYSMRWFGKKCNLNWIGVSNITNMEYMFLDSKFNGDISQWDVSNVTDMFGMFRTSEFNGDISQWDVSNVTEMREMFEAAEFNGDISQWDVSNVTDMRDMFDNSKFNGDISQWDVSNVTDMHGMFWNSVFNGDISQWDVSNVTDMSYMFASNVHFNQDISMWNVSNVANMSSMFLNSKFNGDISQWDVSNVTTMFQMFLNSVFNGDISQWDVGNVTNMNHMFTGCSIKLKYKPKFKIQEAFDFDSVKKQNKSINAVDAALQYIIQKIDNRKKLSKDDYDLLKNCVGIYKVSDHDELKNLIDYFTEQFGNECNLNWIDVSNITDMDCMFMGSKFNGDISQWDVSNVTNMDGMFLNSEFTGDINNWDVSNVTKMNSMFQYSDFNGDISLWDVSNVTDKRYMFTGCLIKSKYKPKFKKIK